MYLLLLLLVVLQGMRCAVDSNSPQLLYSLYGVVEHSGTLRGGHYTAYVRLRSSDTTTTATASQCPLEFIQTLSPSQMSVSHLVAKLRTLCSSFKLRQLQSDVIGSTSELLSDEVPCQLGSLSLPSSDGRWFHISDASVSQVKLTQVLHCQAYILFYERIA